MKGGDVAILDSLSGKDFLIKLHLSRDLDLGQEAHFKPRRRDVGSHKDIWGKSILENPICIILLIFT